MLSRLVKVRAFNQSEIGNLIGIDICRIVLYNKDATGRNAHFFRFPEIKNNFMLRIAVK
jgi:hypothetical protein